MGRGRGGKAGPSAAHSQKAPALKGSTACERGRLRESPGWRSPGHVATECRLCATQARH